MIVILCCGRISSGALIGFSDAPGWGMAAIMIFILRL